MLKTGIAECRAADFVLDIRGEGGEVKSRHRTTMFYRYLSGLVLQIVGYLDITVQYTFFSFFNFFKNFLRK